MTPLGYHSYIYNGIGWFWIFAIFQLGFYLLVFLCPPTPHPVQNMTNWADIKFCHLWTVKSLITWCYTRLAAIRWWSKAWCSAVRKCLAWQFTWPVACLAGLSQGERKVREKKISADLNSEESERELERECQWWECWEVEGVDCRGAAALVEETRAELSLPRNHPEELILSGDGAVPAFFCI